MKIELLELDNGVSYFNDPHYKAPETDNTDCSNYNYNFRPAQIRPLKDGRFAVKNLLWGENSGLMVIYPKMIKRIIYY